MLMAPARLEYLAQPTTKLDKVWKLLLEAHMRTNKAAHSGSKTATSPAQPQHAQYGQPITLAALRANHHTSTASTFSLSTQPSQLITLAALRDFHQKRPVPPKTFIFTIHLRCDITGDKKEAVKSKIRELRVLAAKTNDVLPESTSSGEVWVWSSNSLIAPMTSEAAAEVRKMEGVEGVAD
jgi:hypothetical protein